MKTLPNVFANINPATLPLVGGLPCIDLALLDANFAALIAVDSPLVKTGNFTPVQADMNAIVAFNSASGVALTLNAGLTTGSWLWVFNLGAGVLTLTATINGVVNPTLAQYEAAILWTNGTSWFGRLLTDLIPNATNATNATNSTNLTMNGEVYATSAIATVSLPQMNVKNGDRLLIGFFSVVGATGSSGASAQISWAGTASAVLLDSIASGATCAQGAMVSNNWKGSGILPMRVTGDGTLTITLTGAEIGGSAPTYTNEIWAVFLKKQ